MKLLAWLQKFHSADIFCSKIMVGLFTVIEEMSSFPMSVANNFCDLPLSKYLDSKTVLIYCPHPVIDLTIMQGQPRPW